MTSTAATTETEMAARLRHAVARLNRRLRQESLGLLSPGQASTLAMVHRLGTPTLGALAKAEQMQPPTMTRLIAGLEELGLVRRTVDANDRRVARVSLTAKGERERQRVRALKTEFLVERLRELDVSDRTTLELVELLERIGGDE